MKRIVDKYGRLKVAVLILVLLLLPGCTSAAPAAAVNEEADMTDSMEAVNRILEDEEAAGEESGSGVSVMQMKKHEPVKVRGIYVTGPVAGHQKMEELIQLVEDTELNALVIDIKNDEGLVTYKMQTDTVLEIGSGTNYITDIEELVRKCKEKDIYLIARIVAFKDPYLAEHRPELSVKTRDGKRFYDKSGLAWVNPYEHEVWEYLLEIAKEAANEGFDEIQFDYIRFSTDIEADSLEFGPEAAEKDKIEIITEFTEYAYETLSPLGVYISADVFGTVIDNPVDQKIIGQDYSKLAEYLDYICPMVYPSHYGTGAYGIAVPDAQPYDTVFAALSASAGTLEVPGTKAHAAVRPWLQSFTAKWVRGHISYDPQAVRAQIDAVYDAGYDEWILWNASVNYQKDSLLPSGDKEKEEGAASPIENR